MESSRTCERCNKKCQEHAKPFSCGHTLCSQCIIKIIFFNHLPAIFMQEHIEIQCQCKLSSMKIPVTNIPNLILDCSSNSIAHSSHTCIKHKSFANIYCFECHNCFCDVCIELHREMNPHHMVTDMCKNDIEFDIAKCSQHQRQFKELYCVDCEENICPLCSLRGSKHFGHNYLPVNDYVDVLRSQIPVEHYMDHSEYITKIEQIAVNAKDNLKSTLDSAIEKFDQIIKNVEEEKLLYMSKMENTKRSVEILVQLLRLIYSEFKKLMTSKDINLLRELLSFQKEITGIDLPDLTLKNVEIVQEKVNDLKQELICSLIQPVQLTWAKIVKKKDQAKEVSVSGEFMNTMTLTGHSASVLSLIELTEGRIASGSADTSIKVWEEMTKNKNDFKNTLTIEGHTDSVFSLIELTDGKIASGSRDMKIKIWEIQKNSYRNILTLTGHRDWIMSLAHLKDGRIASGANDKTIKVWSIINENTNTMVSNLTMTGHKDWIHSLIQTKDGRIVSGSDDRTIKVWEASDKDFKNVMTIPGHRDSVTSLVQLNDGRVASGSYDKKIKLWEIKMKDYQNSATLTGHSDYVRSLIQLKDGRIASGSDDKTVKLWEEKDGGFKNSQTLRGHIGVVYSLIQLKDGRIASGSHDKTIKIWEEKYLKNI